MFGKHPVNLRLKIGQQLISRGKLVGPSFIVAGAVPVIMPGTRLAKTRALRRHTVGIVKTDEPVAVRIMQRERIT
jgi:hypothetical protein